MRPDRVDDARRVGRIAEVRDVARHDRDVGTGELGTEARDRAERMWTSPKQTSLMAVPAGAPTGGCA